MKIYKNYILLFTILLSVSCSSDDNENNEESVAAVEIKWDNIVGDKNLELVAKEDLNYAYKTSDDQAFNISTFGYYVTKIILEGPNGERFEDLVEVSANDAKGVYHIVEGALNTNTLLENVPVGAYNKITFTIGVPEEMVKEGAVGGVLGEDGAWFWTWNSGYIGFAVEGHASSSTQTASEDDNGRIVTPKKSFAIHVGGWRDIPAADGNEQKFFNNVKTISLNFDETMVVAPKQQPSIHLTADVLSLFERTNVDFSTTFAVHSPAKGKDFAEVLEEVFSFSHIHQ